MAPQKFTVLTVCLGICRSPMAEAVLIAEAAKRPGIIVTIDSAGTGAYHAGDGADDRAIAVCKNHGVPVDCIARKVESNDFAKFDYILAMDESNLQTLQTRKPRGSRAHITLFGNFEPDLALASPGARLRPGIIEDPYYGGRDGFEIAYDQCVRYARGFLDFLEAGGGEPPKL
ncbi:hypothetical protein CspHIS471_0210410 [Cutaneotrichosporon sp. HIS471]|nr:hypothetical protein CspHIS471_0210410 [Cutaneotrichosporon sp. HIS471]